MRAIRTLNCRYPGLKEWCEKHGMSASVLAERSGIQIRTAQKILYRGGSAKLDTAQLIADGLRCTIDKLFRIPPRVVSTEHKSGCRL